MTAILAKLEGSDKRLEQQQKGFEDWKATTLSEVLAVARSRSASRASSAHVPVLPGISEVEEPQTPTRPSPVLPDILAVDVNEEVAKLRILVRRHKGLQHLTNA